VETERRGHYDCGKAYSEHESASSQFVQAQIFHAVSALTNIAACGIRILAGEFMQAHHQLLYFSKLSGGMYSKYSIGV
jgi:hypothetical protein